VRYGKRIVNYAYERSVLDYLNIVSQHLPRCAEREHKESQHSLISVGIEISRMQEAGENCFISSIILCKNYCSGNIITIIRTRRTKLAEHVTRMGEVRKA
jgi:hypothetical protein